MTTDDAQDANFLLLESAAEAAARLGRRPWPPFVPLKDSLSVSFEFFPPTSTEAEANLWACVEQLAPFAPRFVSVTYGAGGSTRERTHLAVERIIRDTALDAAAHLTCVDASRDEVMGVVDRYLASGVKHIVALRGDPQNTNPTPQTQTGQFEDAAELVAAIRARSDVEISVAAYPETHPKARSLQADLDHLQRKVDAGATRAITQFFFEPAYYLDFLDRARGAGITIPIVPGILPITHFGRMCAFAKRCGTSIPSWMPPLFDGLDSIPEVRALVAATIAAEQCRQLAENGITDFHFYTLNRPELSAATCLMLGIRPTTTNVNQESKQSNAGSV
jgi:methylenetetrahydrofolate reductase (NADPH)